jgi:hypothetical protein
MIKHMLYEKKNSYGFVFPIETRYLLFIIILSSRTIDDISGLMNKSV